MSTEADSSKVLEPPGKLTVFEYRTRLKGGNTRPLVVVGADDQGKEKEVVLKVRHPDYPGGHHEGTSLACELICSVIAKSLDLPVPDYFIASVPRELPECIADRSIRELLRRNLDENFGCLYHPGMSEWMADASFRSVSIRSMLEEVLSFDATVINGDRTRSKPNLLCKGDDLLMIDHSLAIPAFLWRPDQVAESPLFPKDHVVNHCSYDALKKRGHDFSSFPGRWRTVLDNNFWGRLRKVVPRSWEREPGDLDTVFGFLQNRQNRLGDISESLKGIVK